MTVMYELMYFFSLFLRKVAARCWSCGSWSSCCRGTGPGGARHCGTFKMEDVSSDDEFLNVPIVAHLAQIYLRVSPQVEENFDIPRIQLHFPISLDGFTYRYLSVFDYN